MARVRFVSQWAGGTVLRQFDDGNCLTGDRVAARFATSMDNHKRLGIPMDPDIRDGLKTEILVRAGQPFYGIFSGATVDNSCRVAFGFLPQEARDYEVTYRWDHRRPGCTATLSVVGGRDSEANIGLPSGQCSGALARMYLL